MNVLLIVGTVRPGSRTRATVDVVAEQLEVNGVDTTVWDLGTDPVPMADPLYHANPFGHPDSAVRELAQAADAAHGFVLASPIYHGSYSGVLKNCLDHLAIDQFRRKPVGLIAHGKALNAVQVCNDLRVVVRGLWGLASPLQLVTTRADLGYDSEGAPAIVCPETAARLGAFVDEMLFFLHALRAATSVDA